MFFVFLCYFLGGGFERLRRVGKFKYIEDVIGGDKDGRD